MNTQVFEENATGILDATGETITPHAYVSSEAVIVHPDGYREPTSIAEIHRRNRNRHEEDDQKNKD